jgi:outer membrane receptor for ferrienterochelin and colicin
MMRYKNILSLFVILMMVSPVSSFGQDEPLTLEDLFSMDIEELLEIKITGATLFAESANEAPATVIVITDRMIRDRGYVDLSDVLRDIPGCDVIDNAARWGEFNVIRGIDGNDRFLVLIDGHKINPYSGTFLSIGNSISVRMAKQIEVIYGPASAIYGADAFSGIINIITKEAPEKMKSGFAGSYGSLKTGEGTFEFSSPIKNLNNASVSAMFHIYRSDGADFTDLSSDYDIVKTYQPPISPGFKQLFKDHNIYLSGTYKDLRIAFYQQRFDEGNARGMSPNFYFYNEENRWALTTSLLWGTYLYSLTEKSKLTVDLSYINHRQDSESQFNKLSIPGDVSGNYHQYMTGWDKTLKGSLTYSNEFNSKVQIVSGVEYEHTSSIPPYGNDAVLGKSFQYTGENADQIDDALTIIENRIGLFGQVVTAPAKNLKLYTGIRFDYSDLNDSSINPRSSIVYTPADATTLKLLYGTAFQAPSLFYQYEQFGTPSIVMLSSDELNNELLNQKVQSVEFSIGQRINKSLNINLSSYFNHLTNLIVRTSLPDDSVYNKYFTKYTPGLFNDNIGKQVVYGFDVHVNYTPAQKLNTYFYYSFTDATYELHDKVNDLPRVSKHKMWLGATYNRFSYIIPSLRIKWTGDINTSNLNSKYNSGEKQPGNTLVDLALSFPDLIPHTRLFLKMENLLNSDIEHAGLFLQNGIYTSTIPQPGFTFQVGADLRF